MATNIFNFNNPANYDVSGCEIVGGVGRLLANEASILKTKTANFSTPSEYTYDNTLIDLGAGNAKLKDMRPVNATFHATFASNINAVWGSGVLTGTSSGAPTVSGGKLVLTGGTAKYVDYAGLANADFQQTGAVRFKVVPGYSGTPVTDRAFFAIAKASNDNTNAIDLQHASNGSLWLRAYDGTGVNKINYAGGPIWVPVAGQSYVFEVDFDFTTGATRIFIDGVQYGATQTPTCVRSSQIGLLRIGGVYVPTGTTDCSIDELTVFNAVQHTANHTVVTIPATKYTIANPSIDLVAASISESLGISSIESLASTINASGGDSVRYALSQDDSVSFLYYNGTAWAASTGYSQTNTLAEMLAAAAGLTLSIGKFALRAYLHSNDGSTSPDLDTVAIGYKSLQYRTSGGTILTNTSFNAQAVTDFVATQTIQTSNAIKYGLNLNGATQYFNGTAWAASNESNAQLNTAAEILANLATALAVNSTVKLFARLTSGDGSSTPFVDAVEMSFNFGGIEAAKPAICRVYGYLFDISGNPIVNATVSIEVASDYEGEYLEASSHIIGGAKFVNTNSLGYFALDLIQSGAFEGNPAQYKIVITKGTDLSIKKVNLTPILITVPVAESVDITDQITRAAL